jgi:hypothetical protein
MGKLDGGNYPRLADGTVLTPEVLDELAEEAERGYDISKATIVRTGRPSLSDSGESPRLNFRVPGDLFEAAQLRADQEERSVSDLAREALRRFVESPKG